LTPTLRPGGSRAARHGSNSFHPPSDESDGRHRSLRCRGDLTSRCPCGHWHGARLDTAARAMCRGPLAGHAVASSARPCRRAATLFKAPCGASLRVPARRLRRADRKDRPSRIRRQRRRTPRWRTIPCGTVAPRPIPSKGAAGPSGDSRGAVPSPADHSPRGWVCSFGCQSVTCQGRATGCRAGTLADRQPIRRRGC
jgi:hypothetical protein